MHIKNETCIATQSVPCETKITTHFGITGHTFCVQSMDNTWMALYPSRLYHIILRIWRVWCTYNYIHNLQHYLESVICTSTNVIMTYLYIMCVCVCVCPWPHTSGMYKLWYVGICFPSDMMYFFSSNYNKVLI